MRALILAGGKGKRLGALARNVPKPLVEVAGKPIIVRQLELLAEHGVDRVLVLTGHLGDAFPPVLGDGAAWGLELSYRRELTPRGTAGALKDAADFIDDATLVLYGDVVMDVDLTHMMTCHRATDAAATLAVHPNDHPQDSDLVEVDERGMIHRFHPKPRPAGGAYENLVNAALYVVRPELLRHVGDGPEDLARDVFPRLLERGGRLRAYKTADYLKDVGTPERLAAVAALIREGRLAGLSRRCPRPAVFLDRDGVVIEERGDAVRSEDAELLPRTAAAVRRLNDAGFLVFLVTNQPGIAKGKIDWTDVRGVHAKIDTALATVGAKIDDKFVCPHHPEAGWPGERRELKILCDCRKPAPALLLRAATAYNIDLARSYLVGDRRVDTAAAIAAGVTPILVRTGHGRSEEGLEPIAARVADDLLAAVAAFLSEERMSA